MPSTSSRLRAGSMIEPLSLDSLSHGRVQVPGAGLTHLQFRRFAGCPICSLHVRGFASRHEELQRAGVTVVAFFHASADSLARYHVDLPFPVVADPDFTMYRRFGVERSLLGVAHPRALAASLRGMMRAPSNPLDAGGGVTGMPADFLIDERGQVLEAHHGAHADDGWSVDHVLGAATKRRAMNLLAPRGPLRAVAVAQ